MNQELKRHSIAESQSVATDINMALYKSSQTTMPFSFKFHDALGFQVARPASAKISEISDLVKELNNIKPNDNIIIFSSDPNYNLFANEENQELAINTKNMQLTNETKIHFYDLVNLSLHDPRMPKNCASSDNETFLSRLAYKLKKMLESLNNTQINEDNSFYTNIGINTRLSSTKIKTMLYLRNVENKTYEHIAQIIGTSRFTVSRILKQCRNKPISECFKNIQRPHNVKISRPISEGIRQFVKMRRGLVTAKTIKKFILEMYNIEVSYSAIYSTLKHKLKLSRRIGSTYVPWINSMRFKFCRYYFVTLYLDLIQRGFIPASIDESGLQQDRFDKFLYIESGSHHPKSHPLHARQWNLLLGISLDGLKTFELHLGSTNQIHFLAFLNEFLKSLQAEEKKTLKRHFIILDNISFHKTLLIKSLVTKFNIPLLFIPTYSSCLNPVEYVFHFVKEALNYSQTLTWYFSLLKNT